MNEPSNTLAVPGRVKGLADDGADARRLDEDRRLEVAPVGAASGGRPRTRPSPPSASIGSPSIRNSTERTVGKRVSV